MVQFAVRLAGERPFSCGPFCILTQKAEETLNLMEGVNAMAMSRKKPGYVFWKYDKFPGVIWAQITSGPAVDGSVGVASYGQNARIEKKAQIKILGHTKGSEVVAALTKLRANLDAEKRDISERYQKLAFRAAPFLRKALK